MTQLTACLLVYNHAHLISKIIQSILAQTYSDFVFVISDDCSTDNSYEVAKSFEKIDTRIKAFKTINNLGMAGNANYAISFAKSEYIALLHHDDILDKTTFEEWMNCILSDDKISFVFNDYKTAHSESTNSFINKKLKKSNSGNFILKKILLKRWGCAVRGTALIRKKFFDEVGGMDERFGMLSDVDLWMRLASKYDVGYVNHPLIQVLENRPANYPNDYTDFSWKRIFLLFDIHSSNINRNNYPNYFNYIFKRFVFRNKVSFEIIKWNIYGVVRKKYFIINDFSYNLNQHEFFYSRLIRSVLYKFAS
jgi:glycosyltransferase involved in cell wall biosynthesis